MKTSGGLPYRISPRLQSFNYAEGGTFFITICTYEKRCIFGDVIEGEMHLNDIGSVADSQWALTSTIRPNVELDEFQVMPNHLHAILFVPPSPDTPRRTLGYAKGSLAAVVGGYKSAVTSAIRKMVGNESFKVWQPRFYDHGIRTQRGLERAREYIRENPARWYRDRENPNRNRRRKK